LCNLIMYNIYIAMVKNTIRFILASPEPFIYVGIYIAIVLILKRFKKDLKLLYMSNTTYQRFIKYITYVHNAGLFIFSLLTCFFISLPLYKFNGSINSILLYDHIILEDEYLMNICWYFTYSKVWEFLDTFLIMLRGNDTIFLQKYHHAGAIIVWYLSTRALSPTVVFSSQINAFIHTIMYAYYLITSTGRKMNRIKPLITMLQLGQLLSGFYLGYMFYIKRFYTSNDIIPVNIGIIFLLYTIALILLFLQFFIKSYCLKRKHN
jgi:hypothetical protein